MQLGSESIGLGSVLLRELQDYKDTQNTLSPVLVSASDFLTILGRKTGGNR